MSEANNATVSGSRKVEVFEGQDVALTFVTEAYPPIREQRWETPMHVNNNNNNSNTVYKESNLANGYRLAC